MYEVYDCPIISKINDNTFKEKLKNYALETKCCEYQGKGCSHPEIQSDDSLHKNFKEISESLYLLYKTYLNRDFEYSGIVSWSMYTPKNKNTQAKMHNHIDVHFATHLTSLMYITPTDLGTDFGSFKIKPEINKWYVWDSRIYHMPEKGLSKEDRIIIASSVVIK